MGAHFIPQRNLWAINGCNCSMLCRFWQVRHRTDYLMGMDHCLFQNVSLWYAHHNICHYLFMGFLRGAAVTEHSRYLGSQQSFTLKTPRAPSGFDRLFADLRRAVPKPPWREIRRQTWILPNTWRLIDTIVAEHRDQERYQCHIHALRHHVQSSLQVDCF